jgi:F-type H+-transporting ATPase subunit a
VNDTTFTFKVGPITFDGTVLWMTILTVVIVFGLIYWASRNMQLKPKGKQNVLEWVVDFTGGIVRDNLGANEVKNYNFLSFVLFSWLIVSNNIGLVTEIIVGDDKKVWMSPTADPVVTMTLALFVMLLANFSGVKRLGLKGYLKNFTKPLPAITFMNVIEEFTNLLTLGLRLYGNIFAGELLLSLLCGVGQAGPGIGPFHVGMLAGLPIEIIWTGFSIFISCIQAFIFVTLMNVYMSHKILEEH